MLNTVIKPAIFMLAVLIGMPVSAVNLCPDDYDAVAPPAVESIKILTGDAATAMAKLFGLNTAAFSSISLKLGSYTERSVHTKEFTELPSTPSYLRKPLVPYNIIAFSPSPIPSLTFSPYWNAYPSVQSWACLKHVYPMTSDGFLAFSVFRQNTYFAFESPLLETWQDNVWAVQPWYLEISPDDPWEQLLRQLKTNPGWNEPSKLPFQRCFGHPASESQLCLEVSSAYRYPATYADGVNEKLFGFQIRITTHLRSKLIY